MTMPARRPRLAWPFTILTSSNTVRLVAGEDFRYTLSAPGLDNWLPAWLQQLDGHILLDDAIRLLPEEQRRTAVQLAERLYGERVLINGTAADTHQPIRYQLAVEGSAAWVWHPPKEGISPNAPTLPILCQDQLDYAAALRVNRRCLEAHTPWLWATTGPMNRAYVSPLFLPDAGPCLSCLLYHFRRLSPAPDLYDALVAHARAGLAITPIVVSEQAIVVIQQLLLWKAMLTADAEANAALYRLHVVELTSMEVSSHRVWVDPECPECGGRK